MRRLTLLLPAAALVLAACFSSEFDKQWYKPNVDYTAADFERDRIACTNKKRVLDENCMKQHGWAALGGDIAPSVKPESPKSPSVRGTY